MSKRGKKLRFTFVCCPRIQYVIWHIIPKRAPWHGRLWEWIIGLTKQAVKKTLSITLKQLKTIVTQIKAMLATNILYVSPPTLSQLLYGRRIWPIPCPLDSPEDLDDPDFLVNGTTVRRSVDRQARFIRQFWQRWKTEYLISLREDIREQWESRWEGGHSYS